MSKPWAKWLGVVALLAVPSLLPLVCGTTGWFRWSGALYQIAGLLTVLWGINARPPAFEMPSLLGDARQKVTKLLRRRRTVHAVGAAMAGSANVFFRAHVKASGTIDQRVDRLEDELYRLACETDEKLVKLEKDTRQRFDEEAAKWQKAITKLEGQVKEATLGNRYIETFGVALFAAGIVLSALA